MNCMLGTAQTKDLGHSATNTNVSVGQLLSESLCKINVLNPLTLGQTAPAQPFTVHLGHLPLGKERRGGKGCLGGSVGTLLPQHWGKGEWKKEGRKPLIMCDVNASVTHQRLCHSN